MTHISYSALRLSFWPDTSYFQNRRRAKPQARGGRAQARIYRPALAAAAQKPINKG
nr:MAG TPA: hypothetical protein [Inoviridae sp.]